MSHPLPSILLYHPSASTVDRLIAFCDEAGLRARVIPVFSSDEAERCLARQCCALLIACADDVPLFARLAQAQVPRPVIAIGKGLESGMQVTALLRHGASDVFDLLCLGEAVERVAFRHALQLYLERAHLIDEGERVREALEFSLAELQADQKAALQIQKGMLPAAQLELPGGVTASYCLTPSLYLSGDFVDIAVLNGRFAMFYLADVSGHGASSALVTVLLKNMTNRLVRNFRRGSSFDILSPVSTLQRVNRELLETGLGKHLTMFIGLFDLENDTLRYAVGGHHPMPLLRSDSGVRFLEGRGMPVGLFEEPVFEEQEIQLPASFKLALFSDGILEVIPASSMREKEACLLAEVEQLAGHEAESLRQVLMAATVQDAPDDIAVMILSRSPG